ncbi:hypothetical protein P0D69_33000 [Paraburkholderia sediminicola]|uniref:hypothetical protein n=1 Tax=Paraburkholderia sediminicola TaxID=458836 RepID=UPI0038B7F9CD
MGSLGNTLSPTNHDSPIGALMEPIDKVANPLSWVTGGKFAQFENETVPRWSNEALAPITQGLGRIDKSINPLRKIPLFDQIGNIAEAKPADTIGLVVGSIFSGGALDGALAGGGGAGAGAGAAGVGAAGTADAGTAAAIGAGAADAGTAAGLGSGLLADTAGTDLGAGTLAATMGTTAGATGSIGAAGGFGAAGAGALGTGASTLGPTTVGVTGVGNGIGTSLGAGAGQVGTGTYGALNGAAAYGDSGLASTVGTSGGFTMPATYGSSLGEAPTGLYSGLLPGGGMTGTSSGALGGGMSGAVDGTGAVGYGSGAGSTMGGFFNSPALSTSSKWISAAQKANAVGNLANANGGGQPAVAQHAMRSPSAGRGVRNTMPTPAPLPMMSNPSQSMMTMPGANGLPTSTSSYQNLLTNMLGNSQNPMNGLGSGSNFMPGAGGSMNPSYIIPGMY